MDIGFIGLGNMGFGMASNILKAKHSLIVHDLRSSVVDKLVDNGAKAAKDASEVAANSEIVFTSLPGPKEIDEAVATLDQKVLDALVHAADRIAEFHKSTIRTTNF